MKQRHFPTHSQLTSRTVVERLENRQMFDGGPLTPGGIVHGEIASPGEQDTWTFVGHRGDLISIGLHGTPAQAHFDAHGDLYLPGPADRIDSFLDSGSRKYTLEADGTYVLIIGDSNNLQTGSYDISFEGINPVSPNPTPLTPGGIVSGSIDATLDVKEYIFHAEPGQKITLGLTSTATTSGFDALVDLYTPAGDRVDSFLASGSRTYQLDDTGDYVLFVHDQNYADKGSFTIALEGINPISPKPTKLVWGGIVSGSIASPLDVKQLVFTGKDGDSITLAMTSTGKTASFDALVDLYSPAGERLDSFLQSGQRTYTLTQDGQYMLYVHDQNYQDSGAFTIGLEGLNPISPASQALKPGGIVRGSIDARIDVDQLTFTGKAGDLIGLAATGTARDSGFDALFDLYAPSGERVDSFLQSGQRVYSLKENGVYMINVHDQNYADRGYYTIGLEGINPISPDARILGSNVVRSGKVGGIGVDQYLFTAKAGEQMSLVFSATSTTAGFVPLARVYDQSGNLVDTFQPGTRSFTATRGGQYLIQIHDNNFGQEGKYTIQAKWIKPRTGTISGVVFNDLNHNGKQDAKEVGIPSATVFLDSNHNGKKDASDKSAASDVDGNYTITGLSAGTYDVWVKRPAGFASLAAAKIVTLKKAQQVTAANIGLSSTLSISGTLFGDDNGNKKMDASRFEDGLIGWTVYLDKNSNGKRDKNESLSITDAGGNWKFTDVTPGKYIVRAEATSPWKTTTANPLKITLKPTTSSSANLFGVKRIA